MWVPIEEMPTDIFYASDVKLLLRDGMSRHCDYDFVEGGWRNRNDKRHVSFSDIVSYWSEAPLKDEEYRGILPNLSPDAPTNKYQRTINGVTVDVYDVLKAFGVDCPATQHAVKKLLCAGSRGHKDKVTDLKEAAHAVSRAVQLAGGD